MSQLEYQDGVAASLLDGPSDLSIHLVGISSLEIADVACFLGTRGHSRIVGHDLAEPASLEEHFRAAHIGMTRDERAAHWETLSGLELPLRLGDSYLEGLDEADVVIVSQAWRLYPRNAPMAQLIESRSVRVVTPIEVYVALARRRGVATLGVTGSNGKSTTTNLAAHVLEAADVPVVLAGNYRYRGPILESLSELPSHGRLVLEVSNHHLLALDAPLDVAVVTNVTPNHIDEHGSFEAYTAVKRRIVECQREDGVVILNADDPVSREFASSARGRVVRFGLAPGGLVANGLDAGLEDGADEPGQVWLSLRDGNRTQRLLPVDRLPLLGDHNVQNALAAALSVVASGVAPQVVGEALASVEGPPGRLELVRECGGVRLVYDIESTTPESTRRGLEAFGEGTVHLVAGGDDKGLDYESFVTSVVARRARLYLLDGSASESIRHTASARGLEWSEHGSVEGAVREAWSLATGGDVILLSPGARGFYNQHLRDKTSFARIAKRLRRAELGAARERGER